MILTLRELANHLRVNERTILRMQQAGQITGVKIGGQWRFNSSQIDQLYFPGALVEGANVVPLADFTRSHLAIPVSRVVHEDRAVMELAASDASGALDELIDQIARRNLALDVKDLRHRILAREDMLSTGVGNGLAIPHPRDPVATLAEPSVVIFGRSTQGIDFGAMDGKPVHLFFLLCCQNIEMHLHMMGRLAHLLCHDSVVSQLREAATYEELQRVIMEAERQQFLG